MKLHHYNEAYAHMVRRAKFADGTPKPLPKPERNFQDKLKTLKNMSKGISPESRIRLLDYFIQEALTKGQLTEQQASGIYEQLQQDKDKIREQIEDYETGNFNDPLSTERKDFSDGGIDFSGLSVPQLRLLYRRYTGFDGPSDSRQLIRELKRLIKGLDEDGIPFNEGGRAKLAVGALPFIPTAITAARPFAGPLLRKGAEVIGGTALGKRLSDTFFSKSEDEDKKEITPSDDQGSNIEPPKGPKFELKDVLTESIFESMRDPELRDTVKSIINEQKSFFNKKNVDKKTTEKLIKSVENKAMTLPGQQNYKQPVFNKDYLTLFKSYVNENHGGNLSKAVAELGIDVAPRTIQQRFMLTNMGTFGGKQAKALLDIQPGTSTYTQVMETMKSNPKNIFSNINLKIKKGNLSKNSYLESIDLANLIGIDGSDDEQRHQFLKRLRKLDIRKKPGTQGGKAKKFHLGDVLNELSFYTKNERQSLAGDGINYQKARQRREFDQGLSKINSALRKNIVNRLEKTDIVIPKISLAEDMGHAESVEIIEKYPNLFKGSNVKSLQTLVRQDPVINQKILVDQGYHTQNDAIYKQLKNKKINIAEANNLLKLNNDRIKKIIRNEARSNPFFKNQENRIALLQINKNGIVNADMSTVDPFYIYGNINEINSKANKVSDLSKKEINVYLKNLKNQWTDGAAKFISGLKDNQGNRIYSNEDIEEFRDILELPVEGTGSKYTFQKGGPVYGKYAGQIAKLP